MVELILNIQHLHSMQYLHMYILSWGWSIYVSMTKSKTTIHGRDINKSIITSLLFTVNTLRQKSEC